MPEWVLINALFIICGQNPQNFVIFLNKMRIKKKCGSVMVVLYSILHNKRNWIFLVIIFNSDTVCYLSTQCNLYAVEYVRHFSLEDWAFKKSYNKAFHQGLACDLQLSLRSTYSLGQDYGGGYFEAFCH